MKIKVHCLGILDSATVPWAVIAADVKAFRGAPAMRYVLLDDARREALWEMGRNLNALRSSWAYPEGAYGLPGLIRSHHWDARGRLADDTPISTRGGAWHSAETLWVSAEIADKLLAAFYAWRDKYPRRDEAIWAPSWLALTAVQALALASGARVPQADDDTDPNTDTRREAEVSS